MKYFIKGVSTFVLWTFGSYVNTYIKTYAMVIGGTTGVAQFSDSATAYVGAVATSDWMAKISGSNLPMLLALCCIGLIWYTDVVRWWGSINSKLNDTLNFAWIGISLVSALFSLAVQDANAYYNRQDWAEVYNILPNHSAFIIPATGASKDSQKQFESENFLNEKKVGSKRIQIGHAKLQNSGVGIDYYVPTEVLVLLDRTPYVVRWSKETTAESPTNQEMCVESMDSVEICFDTSIGANVLEEDAAKYLYWFGTEPATGSEDERKFPSMLNGKSLQNVMNSRVFARIHTAYFVEFSKFTFLDALAHKGEILKDVESQMITEYKKMGITIEYVGIASQFRFDPALQAAITKLQISKYDQQSAAAKLEAAKVDRFNAETEIMLAQAEPYKKWDGKTFPNVPSVMISSDSVLSWFKGIADSFAGKSVKP